MGEVVVLEEALGIMINARQVSTIRTNVEISTATTGLAKPQTTETTTHEGAALEAAEEVAILGAVEAHQHKTAARTSATTITTMADAQNKGAIKGPQQTLVAIRNDKSSTIFMRMSRRLIPTIHHNQHRK